jgi:carboxymethylenebutenolidase
VNIRGDRLYHEHIAWDQATVLRQLGLLPEHLPFPYPVAGRAATATAGKTIEYQLPVTGADTAHKLRNKDHCGSNQMLEYQVREV